MRLSLTRRMVRIEAWNHLKFWISSRASVDSRWASSVRAASGPSRSVKLKNTLAVFWRNIGLECRFMKTCETLIVRYSEPMASDPMLSAEAFRAKISAAQALDPVWLGQSPLSGPNTPDSFATWSRATSSWRTSQTCFIEGWESYSETWPRRGTMRNGVVFQLPSPGYPKRATESGLLPTLISGDAAQAANGSRDDRKPSDGLTMTDWVRLNIARKKVPLELGEAMMGFPDGWTECAPLETPSFRKSRK